MPPEKAAGEQQQPGAGGEGRGGGGEGEAGSTLMLPDIPRCRDPSAGRGRLCSTRTAGV